MADKPSDFAIVLAVGMFGERPVYADEVRGQLTNFGFEATTSWSYRLTQWGRTELWNRGLKNLGVPLAELQGAGR